MDYKICSECGSKVDINSNFCPDCGGKSFNALQTPKVANGQKPSLIHSLLYWDHGGYFVISKSKIIGISTFLVFFITFIFSGSLAGGIVISLIVALLVFLVGFCIHKLFSHPSKVKLEYSDYGVIPDLGHFLFFWQNKKTGEFVLSKTKVISNLIFVLFALFAFLWLNPPNFLAVVLFALLFEIPAFIIGYVLHKITNPNPTNPKVVSRPKQVPKTKEVQKPKTAPKIPTPQTQTVSGFDRYKKQIDDLESEFSAKEDNVRNLIEKRFEPPQLTYTKFTSVVDKSSELFKNQAEASRTIINLSSECSPKIENELKSKIEVLETIIAKLDALAEELVLVEDKSQDNDVHDLFDDMEDLIKSVKDYD